MILPNCFVALLLLSSGILCATALWPIPSSLSNGTTAIKMSSDFDIHVDISGPPADLLSAVERTKSRIATGRFQRLVIGRGSADAGAVASARTLTSLSLIVHPGRPVRSIANETNQPITSRSEGYSLSIGGDSPSATLTANSTLGLLRGLATFEQLWYDLNGTKYLLNGGLDIVDDAAFVGRDASPQVSKELITSTSPTEVFHSIPPEICETAYDKGVVILTK